MFDFAELFQISSIEGDPFDPSTKITTPPPESGEVVSLGIVEDNTDPDGMGRLKVKMILVPGQPVTDWIPLVRPYGGPEQGWFILPAVGEQVFLAFVGGSVNRPVALGSMYTPTTGADLDAKPRNNEKFFFSKAGFRISFDDTMVLETLEISSPDGDMSLSISRFGLSISNEIGDIEITTKKKFEIDTNELAIDCEKEFSLSAAGVKLESGQSIKLKAEKEVEIKGSQIKLDGSGGVTAGMKQIAAQNDQVVGVDMHIVMVPTPPGAPVPTPLPHPFIGKLDAELSQNVKIGTKAAATKGSKAHNNPPNHLPTPPGISFQKPPKNEAEITQGTCSTVKINNKEAATLTSMASSCDDTGVMNQSTVIAMGAAVPGVYTGPKTSEKDSNRASANSGGGSGGGGGGSGSGGGGGPDVVKTPTPAEPVPTPMPNAGDSGEIDSKKMQPEQLKRGQEFEKKVLEERGLTKNGGEGTQVRLERTGDPSRYHIPDSISDKEIVEIKDCKNVKNTPQMKTFNNQGKPLTLIVSDKNESIDQGVLDGISNNGGQVLKRSSDGQYTKIYP